MMKVNELWTRFVNNELSPNVVWLLSMQTIIFLLILIQLSLCYVNLLNNYKNTYQLRIDSLTVK
jgi:hypothetical protein